MSRTLSIASFCSPFLLTAEKEISIVEIMHMMKEADIRHIPIVDNGDPVGIISERDLKVFEDRDFADKFCAGDIMVQSPFTVHSSTELRDVVNIMSDKKYGSCLVRDDDGKVSGIFTMVDALRTLRILLDNNGEDLTLHLGS